MSGRKQAGELHRAAALRAAEEAARRKAEMEAAEAAELARKRAEEEAAARRAAEEAKAMEEAENARMLEESQRHAKAISLQRCWRGLLGRRNAMEYKAERDAARVAQEQVS